MTKIMIHTSNNLRFFLVLGIDSDLVCETWGRKKKRKKKTKRKKKREKEKKKKKKNEEER